MGGDIIIVFSFGLFWTTGEILAFIFAFLLFSGNLGSVLKVLLKVLASIIVIFAVLVVVGLYILNNKLNTKAVATVTDVENSSVIGGYYQKLSIRFTYKNNEYELSDIDTSNLLAEVGDKYMVYFSSHNPYDIRHIEVDDKLPTPFQAFISSLKYAFIGIIAFLIFIKIIRSRI